MIMDEPSLHRTNPTWYYSSPVHVRMSWDQSSYLDDRDYRFSNTNTPQRGPAADGNTDESQANDNVGAPSPYPGGQAPYGYGGFPLVPQVNDQSYPFPEIGGIHYGHQSPSHQHVTIPPRRFYEEEEEETDISPPPALKRTTTHNFELSLSHSTSSPNSGSSGASKKLKLSHESSSPEQDILPEHRDASEQKSAERVHGTTIPHPSDYAFAVPEYAGPPPDIAFAAARMYAFDDSTMADPNAAQISSPIKSLPVQAARKPAAKKKSGKAKAKRTSRRTTKKAAANRKTAAAGQSTKEKARFVPTEAELLEAHNPRAQQALRTWYMRLGELHDYKAQFGNCSVPQKYPPNPSLGTWVNKQRMEYKMFCEGGKHSLSETKRQKLESIGFDWGKRKGDASWEQKFQELQEYKANFKDCPYLVFLLNCMICP